MDMVIIVKLEIVVWVLLKFYGFDFGYTTLSYSEQLSAYYMSPSNLPKSFRRR